MKYFFPKSNQTVSITKLPKALFQRGFLTDIVECLSPAFEFCMNCFSSWDHKFTSEGNWPQTQQVVLKILISRDRAKMAINKMCSLVFLLVGSFSQRVKIPGLPTCEGHLIFYKYLTRQIPHFSITCNLRRKRGSLIHLFYFPTIL